MLNIYIEKCKVSAQTCHSHGSPSVETSVFDGFRIRHVLLRYGMSASDPACRFLIRYVGPCLRNVSLQKVSDQTNVGVQYVSDNNNISINRIKQKIKQKKC